MLPNPALDLPRPKNPEEAHFFDMFRTFFDQAFMPALNATTTIIEARHKEEIEAQGERYNSRLDSIDKHFREATRDLHDSTRENKEAAVESRENSKRIQDLALSLQGNISALMASDKNQDGRIDRQSNRINALEADMKATHNEIAVMQGVVAGLVDIMKGNPALGSRSLVSMVEGIEATTREIKSQMSIDNLTIQQHERELAAMKARKPAPVRLWRWFWGIK